LGLQEALIPVGQHLGKVQRHIFCNQPTKQRQQPSTATQLLLLKSNIVAIWLGSSSSKAAHTPFDYDNHYYLE
jgi:hypothetical protein